MIKKRGKFISFFEINKKIIYCFLFKLFMCVTSVTLLA